MQPFFTKTLSAFALILILSSCFKNKEADLVIHNAVIYTMDENNTIYAALAVKDGKIIDIGAEREIMNRYRAKSTIDARKMYLYPGFYDAHSHFLGYCRNKADVKLFAITSEKEMIKKVSNFAASSPREWVIGRGWDNTTWENNAFPDKSVLDSLFPNRPVFLTRVDGHAVLVNQAALDIAGVNTETEVDGGIVMKDESGNLTGILLDNANSLVKNQIPPISHQLLFDLIKQGEADCLAAGLTTVTDAGLPVSAVQMIDSLQQAGYLNINIVAMLQPGEGTISFMENGPLLTPKLSARALKLYGDGALGSRGALLKQPYSDSHDLLGIQILDTALYHQYADACNEYGFQLCTHCIGDSSNAEVLQLYAKSLGGMTDKRWRIEHAQVVSESDRHYFKDFAIIPSVQPTHATSDGDWAGDRLGESRMEGAYAYNSLKNELGIVALGTDFPVERIFPIETFYAAVFRKDRFGIPTEGFRMEEALTREDALRGMTIWAALASFEEAEKGSIEIGKRADFVLLDYDLLKAAESDILKTKVVKTILNGEEVK